MGGGSRGLHCVPQQRQGGACCLEQEDDGDGGETVRYPAERSGFDGEDNEAFEDCRTRFSGPFRVINYPGMEDITFGILYVLALTAG